MVNYPLIGALAPSLDSLPRPKRDWRASLFDRLGPASGVAGFELSDDEKERATRQGLLGLAGGLLSTPGGFGNALGQGIQGGLLALNQGADDTVNNRYKQQMMQRTMAGMDRNTQAEELARRAVRKDGTIDQQVYSQLAAMDPERAKSLREAIEGRQTRWQMGRIGDGQGGEVDVLFDPLDPSQIRTIDGKPINGGSFGATAPSQGSTAPAGPPSGFEQLAAAVMAQESGGNPNAVSPKGAMGTMQTMPGTLRDPGFGIAPAKDQSPAEMERVGRDYLREMIGKFGPEGGLAAYNWGPGNWERALASAGGDVQRALASAPQETQKYVPGVQRRLSQVPQSAGLGRRPAKAGKNRDAPSGYTWANDGASLVPIPGGPADRKNNPMPADQAKDERQMRQELSTLNKESLSIVQAYKRVQSAAANPDAAGDLSLIFGYMKMLDPNSVVREQEFANAQNAAGVPDQVRNMFNRVKSGERLNPNQREQFLGQATKLHDLAQSQIATKTMEYADIADQYGYDPVRATGHKLGSKEARERFNRGASLLKEARDAVMRGADKERARQRMIELGFPNLAERL